MLPKFQFSMATFILYHFWPRLMDGARTMGPSKNSGYLFAASINQFTSTPKVFVLLYFKGATLISPLVIRFFLEHWALPQHIYASLWHFLYILHTS
jgi:hypothetical protein